MPRYKLTFGAVVPAVGYAYVWADNEEGARSQGDDFDLQIDWSPTGDGPDVAQNEGVIAVEEVG